MLSEYSADFFVCTSTKKMKLIKLIMTLNDKGHRLRRQPLVKLLYFLKFGHKKWLIFHNFGQNLKNDLATAGTFWGTNPKSTFLCIFAPKLAPLILVQIMGRTGQKYTTLFVYMVT